MLRFFYNPNYKYTNRSIINIDNDSNYVDKDYANIDSPDTINGHIIYQLNAGEKVPSYILDTESNWRWFVSGITQLRTNKYQISLLRDIISEQPNLWASEQSYISAGQASDYNKYKTWGLPYTNTKVKEQRLTINGKSSYFVFYVNTQKLTNNTITEEDLVINSTTIPGVTGYDIDIDNINDIPFIEFVNAGTAVYWKDKKASTTLVFNVKGSSTIPALARRRFTANITNGNDLVFDGGPDPRGELDHGDIGNVNSFDIRGAEAIEVFINTNNSRTNLSTAFTNFVTSWQDSKGTRMTAAQVEALKPYVNKVIYNRQNNEVFRIINKETVGTYNEGLNGTATDSFKTALRNINWPASGLVSTYEEFGDWVTIKSNYVLEEYTIEQLGNATSFDFNFIADTRKLPKSAVRCVNIVADDIITDSDISQCLMLAQTNAVNPNEDTGRILDIQFLPFQIANDKNENIKINNTPLTAAFIDFDDIYYDINLGTLESVNKETDKINIVSPSRASQFMFSPYNNNGKLSFTVAITLKPYTTAMYIRPTTEGLLLNNFNDKNCLIINEDFSLTQVTSVWTEYIYQNKNFQNTFNREIQGREFERTWERRVEQAQAKSDEWTARNISSQKAQTYTGNLPIISNVAGAVGSAWADSNYLQAAQLDREYNEALYQEGLSLSKDLFTYQMENLSSQPVIPSKITTIDCKLLDGVYLEYWSTNDTELNAIKNYYKYNGNRIDSYGQFSAYWGAFVRGKIILSQNYTQPEFEELNRRLQMGIFTGGFEL